MPNLWIIIKRHAQTAECDWMEFPPNYLMSIHQAIFGMQKSSRAAKTQLIYFFARSPSISVNLHQQISMLCLLGIWQGTQSVKYMEQSIKSFPELMGARSSKSRLCKEDLEFLKEKTRYDESTITEWYKGFIQVNQWASLRQANEQDFQSSLRP